MINKVSTKPVKFSVQLFFLVWFTMAIPAYVRSQDSLNVTVDNELAVMTFDGLRPAGAHWPGLHIIQVGGGYTSTGITTTFEEAKGYLFNASYEHWFASQVGVGGSAYFIHGSLEDDDGGKGDFSSIPLCFTGKYYLGKGKIKGFAMALLGAQFSWRNLEDSGGKSGSDHDWGLAAGGGLGLVYTITPKVLISLNYSLLILRNAYYSDGVVNALGLNLGYIMGGNK